MQNAFLKHVICLLGIILCNLSCVYLIAADREPVRWPDWAKRTYVGIQDARDQQSHELKVLAKDGLTPDIVLAYEKDPTAYAASARSDSTDEKEKDLELCERFLSWKERKPLYQLDTEVDMLASALLALERPEVVIDLYQRWYDEVAVQKCLEGIKKPQATDMAVGASALPVTASATSTLEISPSAEEIWNAFYTRNPVPTFKHFRTPAAILFYSRAHRDRALKTLETPGLVKDRLTAFEEANQDMAKAFYWLERSRKEISNLVRKADESGWDGGTDEESFAFWMQQGLPRPHSLYSWSQRRKTKNESDNSRPVPDDLGLFISDKNLANTETNRVLQSVIDAPEKIDQDALGIPASRPFPAFQALDFAVKFFEWEARIKRELGDMVYRVTGGTGKPKGASRGTDADSSDSSPTAAAYYIEARDVLYLARMIDPKNRQLYEDARAIDARIDWMQKNLPYGGQDFYQFQPYSPSNYFTVWQERLSTQVTSMESDWRDLRAQREKAAAWVNQIQAGDRGSDMLKQQFNFQMNFAIREKMADIKFDLVNLETDRARSALQNLQDESQTFLAESSLQLDSLVYEQEIARVKDQIVDDALTRIGEIRRDGSLSSFRESFFPASGNQGRGSSALVEDVGYQRLYFTTEERREDLALVHGMVSNDRRLRLSFGKIEVGNSALPEIIEGQRLSSSDFAPGIIDEKEALWQVAALELQMARARLRNYENVLEVEVLSKQEAIFKTSGDDILKEIRQYNNDYEANQEAERKNTESKIQTSILDRAKREVERAKDHVKRAENNIQKFRDHIARTRQTIKKIKEWGDRAEQAYDMFKSLTAAFSTTPATIAGPMGGPIVDPAGSFEKKGRAALDRIKAAYQNLVQSQSFDELLQKLDKEAESMQSSLATLRSEADERVKDLETTIMQSDLKFVLAVPEAEVFQGIKAKVDAIKQENVQDLQDALTKIHTDFNAEAKGTFFEQRGNRVSAHETEKAKARIESFDRKVQEQVDQAFEQTRVRFVTAVHAIESWRQKNVEASGDPNAGRVYAEYMTQKAEAEKRLAEANLRKAAISAERGGKEEDIGEADRIEHETLVKVAQEREKAARAAMVSAIIDQETAWLRLVHTAIRWNRANDQAAELSSQIENIKIATDRLKSDRQQATSDLSKAEDKQSEAMKEQVARIEQLAAELKQMNSPEGRIVTADMLDRLAPGLIAMDGTSEAQQRMRDGLDKANNLLGEYARWLYLLSGDSACRLYATRCDSYGELILSQQGLDRIASETLTNAGLARAGFLRVRVPIAGENSKFLRLSAGEIDWPSIQYVHVCRGQFGMEFREPEPRQEGYDSGVVLEIPSFDLPSTNRVAVGTSDLPMLLCGFMPLVKMQQGHEDKGRGVSAVLRPVAAASSGLQSPFQVPFKYAFHVNPSASRQRSTLIYTAETITGFVQAEQRMAAENKSLVHSPALLPNYEYFGRSVYGGYRLDLQGDVANVDHVDVYVYYISPATNAAELAAQPRGTNAPAKRLSLVADLKLPTPEQVGPANAPSPSESKPVDPFDLAWSYSESNLAGKDSHENLLQEVKELVNGIDSENEKIKKYITGTDVDPHPSDLNRPIALRKSLQTCSVLLHLLSEDVRQRAEEPLHAAATVVKNQITPNRVTLSAINTIVADHNTRFQNLQKHVAKLKLINDVLNGTAINLEEGSLTSLENQLVNENPPYAEILRQLASKMSTADSDDLELLIELSRNLRVKIINAPHEE